MAPNAEAAAGASAPKTFTEEDVAKHNTEEDCWMAIFGKVYDVTKFLDDHPGGPEILMNVAGMECTEQFEEVFHSDKAKEMLADYYLGELEGWEGPTLEDEGPSSRSAISSNSGGALYLIPLIVVLLALAYQFMA